MIKMKYITDERIKDEIVRQFKEDYDNNILANEFMSGDNQEMIMEEIKFIRENIELGMSLEGAVSYMIEMDYA